MKRTLMWMVISLAACGDDASAGHDAGGTSSGRDAGSAPLRDGGGAADPDAGADPTPGDDAGAPRPDAALPPGESYAGIRGSESGAFATAFPIIITFDDDRYESELHLPWVVESATHTHDPTGGWDGRGAARFTPPSTGEGMAGLGQFHALHEVANTELLSIRYCLRAGARFPQLASGAKPIILWRGEAGSAVDGHTLGARPMVISRPDPGDRGIAYGVCDGTTCTYVGGDFWPDGSDTWLVTGDAWSCVEFEFDLASDRMTLFVSTRDGRFDDTEYLTGTFRDDMSGPGGVVTLIDTIGGYFAQSVADPENYYVIDDLVIDVAHIGPPAGFVR
jgi:hypothetical protein